MIEVLLRLQRVVHAVVAGLVEFHVIHPWVVAVMLATRGLDQAMGHERASGDDGIDDALINEIADDEPLLGHGHGPGQGHDHEAIFVARHGFQHIGCFTKLAAGKGGIGHASNQVIGSLNLPEVEGEDRRELIFGGVVQFAVDSDARAVVVSRHFERRRHRRKFVTALDHPFSILQFLQEFT